MFLKYSYLVQTCPSTMLKEAYSGNGSAIRFTRRRRRRSGLIIACEIQRDWGYWWWYSRCQDGYINMSIIERHRHLNLMYSFNFAFLDHQIYCFQAKAKRHRKFNREAGIITLSDLFPDFFILMFAKKSNKRKALLYSTVFWLSKDGIFIHWETESYTNMIYRISAAANTSQHKADDRK